MREAKRSLINLIIGIWIAMVLFTAVAVTAGFFFKKPLLPIFLGELLGSLISTGLACHMYYSLDVSLDIGEKARGYARRAAFLRSICVLFVLVLSFYLRGIFYPLTTFLGLYGMKLSVYLQPFIKNIQKRKEIK